MDIPSEFERLRRLIEADKELTYLERLQAVDRMLNELDALPAEERAAHEQARELREEEGHRIFREFIQRQLAMQSEDAVADLPT